MNKWVSVLASIPICIGVCTAQEQQTQTPGTAQSMPRSTGDPSATMRDKKAARESWVGILVDSRCSSPKTLKGGLNDDSLLNRSTAAESGRTWNSTDNNTSGTAERSGSGTARNAATADMNGTVAGSRDKRQGPRIIADRGAAANRPSTGQSDTAPGKAETATAKRDDDMPRITGSEGSGRGPDTQSASNPKPADKTDNLGQSCRISPATTNFAVYLDDGGMLKLDDVGNVRASAQLQSAPKDASKRKVYRVSVSGRLSGDVIHVTDLQLSK